MVSFGAIVWSGFLVLCLLAPPLRNRHLLKLLVLFGLALLITFAEVTFGETAMNVSATVAIIAIAALGIWANSYDPKEAEHQKRVKLARLLCDERRAKGIKWP